MKLQKKRIVKPILFSVILLVLLLGVNFLFRPFWTSWNNYDTSEGFYDQPDNTIETLFLGTSTMGHGVIPMELYEDYGICAYSITSEMQPMLMTYYWLKEVYDYHSESLTTVVLDVSGLRQSMEEAFFEKSLLGMRFSSNKLAAIADYSEAVSIEAESILEEAQETGDTQEILEAQEEADTLTASTDAAHMISYLFPLFSYHTRWKELEELDYQILSYETDSTMRGYNFSVVQVINSYSYDNSNIGIPAYLTDNTDASSELKTLALEYLDKIVTFCSENDLELILIRTPTQTGDWSDARHNEVQKLADSYGLTFLDFNYSPYVEEIDYNAALDKRDSKHLNYWGASKLTAWLGEYLTENCRVTDVRGSEDYAFLEDELEEYQRSTLAAALCEITDPAEYIETVNAYEDFSVLITVTGNAAAALTEEQRSAFSALGLTELAGLEEGDSYLAVMENGEVVYEEVQRETDADAVTGQCLTYTGTLSDHTSFTLQSGGTNLGNGSSCVIGGTEYAGYTNDGDDESDTNGISIVVWNTRKSESFDTALFETGTSSERTKTYLAAAYEEALASGIVPEDFTELFEQITLYNLLCADTFLAEDLRNAAEDPSIQTYLSAFLDTENNENAENYVIILTAEDDSGDLLNTAVQELLSGAGFAGLFSLQENESYAAVLDTGSGTVTEITAAEPTAAQLDLYGFLSVTGVNTTKEDTDSGSQTSTSDSDGQTDTSNSGSAADGSGAGNAADAATTDSPSAVSAAADNSETAGYTVTIGETQFLFPAESTVNIVIYNKETETIVDAICYASDGSTLSYEEVALE